MDEEATQQIANAVMAQIKPELENLRTDVNSVEQKAEQRNKTLRKEIRKLRDQGSRDRDNVEMLKNQMQGAMALSALGGGRGPEPVRYSPTGTGLIDPPDRWEREHPFR